MAKVIGMQEHQLKNEGLGKKRDVIIFNKELSKNNASLITESLSSNSDNSKLLDMEGQSVNLNAFSIPTINPVVNNETTNQVFGETVDLTVPTFSGEQVNQVNLINSNDNAPLTSENLPYQEPVITNPVPTNVMSDEAFVNYINSLRNMLSDFMNDMNSKLDKLQEEFLSKTGANLLNAGVVSDTNTVEPVVVTPEIVSSPVSIINTFDPNETLVTNNLVQDINEARGMVESGFSKAA